MLILTVILLLEIFANRDSNFLVANLTTRTSKKLEKI